VQAQDLSPQQLEILLERLLRQKYMKNPHVSVLVKQVESHAVSVFGAVQKPGVFQIRNPESLIEVLAMAQGLADDAGDTIIVTRHGGAPTPASADSPDPTPAGATATPV
jgi:polysaccharide export outer membrane protein